MSNQTIWEMVQECACQLTRKGISPFTRKDIVACVQSRRPRIDPNSINPIIQGLTNNLKGGAPGADGKNILYSVGRGQFVLYSKRNSFNLQKKPPPAATNHTKLTNSSLPDTENELRDLILKLLKQNLKNRNDIELIPEGSISYGLPDGTKIRHASDILVNHATSKKQLSIEIKYKSAVTDQFKCRAYDAIHMKKEIGKNLCSIMLFVKTKSGVSIAQARRLSYPFDIFIGSPVSEFGSVEIDRIANEITKFLD